ncbi:MAG TPA: hypothetical protein VFA78_02665 [Chloroflexota bacterium]|nr:hypothetical protein [Chloroflexota bacterium]
MNLIFERGDRDHPVGHALVYFRANDGSLVATYVTVPPIQFDLSSYMPGFLAGAMQGMDLGESMTATPIPPIPETIDDIEYLQSLAGWRHDDLVFAGGTMTGDPMRLAAEAAEAARQYGDLYRNAGTPQPAAPPEEVHSDADRERFTSMSESDKLNELTRLTGRLRDVVGNGGSDEDLEHQMRVLADLLPAKYRARELVDAATQPGERGQRLAELHLERCYKLHNEEYLDLERIDREIQAINE